MTKNEIYIYNSLPQKKILFIPINSPNVNLYVCGMTVYDFCHLGHARVMIFFDIVYRYLGFLGYTVNYVRNITDIDDKIIQRAHKNKESIEALVERFIKEMNQDSQALYLTPPSTEPRATAYILQIVELITILIEKNFAYVTKNGDVCFKVEKFPNYGKLSHQKIDKLRAGARISVFETKSDPLDFVLWKLAKPEEPSWDSPWGKGRPGWHIECSAMSMHCLGSHIDIHGGGLDLIFPHHENEIAQSEAATDQPFVNTWMHVGHVRVNEQKMSKSLGNFFTIREILKKYDAEVIRYFMLTSHYRSPINYTETYLDQAQASLQSFYTALLDLENIDIHKNIDQENIGQDFRLKFYGKMNNDFNTPEALAVLFEIVHEINRLKKIQDVGLASQLGAILRELASILGILQKTPKEFFQKLSSTENIDVSKIEHFIAERNQARAEKNWGEADKIRQEIALMNIIIEDSPEGTKWRKA